MGRDDLLQAAEVAAMTLATIRRVAERLSLWDSSLWEACNLSLELLADCGVPIRSVDERGRQHDESKAR